MGDLNAISYSSNLGVEMSLRVDKALGEEERAVGAEPSGPTSQFDNINITYRSVGKAEVAVPKTTWATSQRQSPILGHDRTFPVHFTLAYKSLFHIPQSLVIGTTITDSTGWVILWLEAAYTVARMLRTRWLVRCEARSEALGRPPRRKADSEYGAVAAVAARWRCGAVRNAKGGFGLGTCGASCGGSVEWLGGSRRGIDTFLGTRFNILQEVSLNQTDMVGWMKLRTHYARYRYSWNYMDLSRHIGCEYPINLPG